MSAYIVDERVIAELAKVYATPPHRGFIWERLEEAARVLAEQNMRSVCYRYDDAVEAGMIPDDFVKGCIEAARRLGDTGASGYTVVELLKAADCLEYQSCETSDWESTAAFKTLSRIRSILIQRLPGYDEAEWGLAERG